MSDYSSKRPKPKRRPADAERSSFPQPALDAVLAGTSGDPIRRALWLDTLDRRLHDRLPRELAAHARLANVDGARLVYVVDSPLWNAKLRMTSADLIDTARKIGLDVTDVVIRTASRPLRQATTAGSSTPAPRSLMSPAAAQALHAALASLEPAKGSAEEPRPDGKTDAVGPPGTGHPTGAGRRGS